MDVGHKPVTSEPSTVIPPTPTTALEAAPATETSHTGKLVGVTSCTPASDKHVCDFCLLVSTGFSSVIFKKKFKLVKQTN